MLCKNISDVLFTQFLTAANRVKMKHKKIADIQYKNEWVSNVSAISWWELIVDWLIDWLIDWLMFMLELIVDWLIDWLIDWCLTSSEQCFSYILVRTNSGMQTICLPDTHTELDFYSASSLI